MSSVTIELNGAEALVFYDWLRRFNEHDHSFDDQAEERVLWDIEAMLEKRLVEPLAADYDEKLLVARKTVRDPG